MDFRKEYEKWLSYDYLNDEMKADLEAIKNDPEEIEDRFYKTLEFGTAGLRGKLGAGINRMNIYTVGQATEGFARMIEEDGQEAKDRGVSICYDVRHKSDVFAKLSAEIFASYGIKVYIYKEALPTPVLSYTVQAMNSYAGVMVTASHNPKEYNGYKAYNGEGSQILDDWASRIENNIKQITDYSKIPRLDFEEGLKKGIIEYVPDHVLEDYYKKVLDLTIHDEDIDKSICVVYSPVNGTGNKPVREVLKRRGFNNIHIVKEEENPDPDFTTTGYPNPEKSACFKLSEKLGAEVGAELLFATDPDCDRIAIEVRRDDGSYQFVNGNHIGAILVNYIVSELAKTGKLPENGAVIKSIVTGDIAEKICQKYGLSYYEVLTGFKNIAAPMIEWAENGEKTFVFGYEESIGFNRGEFVRDKDAVSSAMLIVEAAAYYKKTQGKNLLEVLDDIYDEYGYHGNKLISVKKEGPSGAALINKIMDKFRKEGVNEIDGSKCVKVIDYKEDETGLPKSNVLKYRFDNGSWCAVRPSGTEPLIKIYMYSEGENEREADRQLEKMEEVMLNEMNSIE